MKNNEGKTFERELPRGYKIALTIDAKDKRLAIIFNVVAIFVMFAVMAIAFIPLLFNIERLIEADDVYVLPVLLLVFMIAYIVLHELVHGIAYKIQTGEKLTYGISFSCAFCGVPRIFTYRKTAIASVLAPTVVFSFILLPVMVVYYYVNAYTYLMFALIFALHLGGCCCDIYLAYLLLTKYKDDKVLMNDTGPKMTLFVKDEACADSFDEETSRFIAEFNERKDNSRASNKKSEKDREKDAVAFSIVCAVFFAIGAVIFTIATISEFTDAMLYEAPPILYKLISFYLAIICVAGFVYCIVSLKKQAIIKIILIVLMVIFAFPSIIICATQDENISYTTDIKNYGEYDYLQYMPDYFPEQITDEMKPLEYSYYFDYSWDWCYELYLEVEMTSEEYDRYKAEYSEKLVSCWFDGNYSEYIKSDKLNLSVGDEGRCYALNPQIEKILFNDADKTVIFWAMCGIDPFYFENSAFFKKFQIDPKIYEEQTTAKEEK